MDKTAAILPPLNTPNAIDMPTKKPVGKGAIDVTPRFIFERLFMFCEPRQSTKINNALVVILAAKIRIFISINEE